MTSFPVRECGDGLRELEEDFALNFPAPNTLAARNAASLPVFNDETAGNFFFLKNYYFLQKNRAQTFYFFVDRCDIGATTFSRGATRQSDSCRN
jgi:hypothetical protein